MLSKLRAMTKKQVALMVVSMSLFGAVGAVGVSQAATPNNPTQQQCNQMGFSDYGVCVAAYTNGHGYGGSGYESTTETTIHTITRSWGFNFFNW